MRSVGLKILKNKLSEYVRLAVGGETVLITDRDRVVAEIVPRRVAALFFQMHGWPRRSVRAGLHHLCSPAVTHRRVNPS
jgi:antitoxin (DNA-binding transcriptional repressor) of toxin-antitoxin stability system